MSLKPYVSLKPEEEVSAVIHRYVNAYINADEAALRDVFDQNAVTNGYVGERLVVGSPEPFIQRVSTETALADQGLALEYNIEHISVTGNSASVVLKEYGFGDYNFIDYMHLLRRDGVWRIVSKTFSTF